MGKLTYSVSVSRDGFAAGPEQSREHPLGVGGEALHSWLFELAAWRERHGLDGGESNESTEVFSSGEDAGALIMGRKMFGGGGGEWDESWRGWWGDDPPFHVPVFVLTHLERASLVMSGGTTFHFVTGGIHSALARARQACQDGDVEVSGGTNTAAQFLAVGLLDEVVLHEVPVDLGEGERLFNGLDVNETMRVERVIDAPGVRHVLYVAKSKIDAA